MNSNPIRVIKIILALENEYVSGTLIEVAEKEPTMISPKKKSVILSKGKPQIQIDNEIINRALAIQNIVPKSKIILYTFRIKNVTKPNKLVIFAIMIIIKYIKSAILSRFIISS